jgi:heparosan-N-sulfate-glucuronate 5-epimerase
VARRHLRGGSAAIPLGLLIEPSDLRGYYIDFRVKAERPDWPPPWFPWPGFHRFMAIAQWGLGSYERYLLGEGESWLTAAIEAGRYAVEQQVVGGRHDGGWLEPEEYPHTFRTTSPWLSAMAQGQCASLLARLYRETESEGFAAAAVKALRPMSVAARDGGVQASLSGRPFPEEYPTDPPSFVLNGALFSLWGYFDVWRGLGHEGAGRAFIEGADTLAENLHRWDTGFWSRYDLYPHPIVNVASSFYHRLHIDQLRAMALIHPMPELAEIRARFEAYAASPSCRSRALAQKVLFRMIVRK